MKRFVVATALAVALAYSLTPALVLAQAAPTVIAPAAYPVDAGPAVVSILDLVTNSLIGLVSLVVSGVVLFLAPLAKNFLSAAVIDMASKRIEAGGIRVVRDILGELRKRAEGGDLTITVGSSQVAAAVNYLMAQFPVLLRLAGMDKEAVERFVRRLFGQELNAAPVVAAAISAPPTVTVGDVQDALKAAVREVLPPPPGPFGGLGR